MDEEQTRLWRYFIAELDDQAGDWRASQQSLAASLLERFDEWVAEREARTNVHLLRQTGRWTKDTATVHIVDDKGCLESWIGVLCKAGNERKGFVALSSSFWIGSASEATCPACIEARTKQQKKRDVNAEFWKTFESRR